MKDREPAVSERRTPADPGPTLSAVVLLGAVAIYLYHPYMDGFAPRQYAIPAWHVLGGLGAFLLSRRWIHSFPARCLAGMLYGFGPYMFSFDAFHPVAGAFPAAAPWLLCPAALWRPAVRHRLSSRAVAILLTAGAFGGLLVLSVAADRLAFYPVPRLTLFDTNALQLILASRFEPGRIHLGLYHAPWVLLTMGLCLYAAVHRIGVLIAVAAGLLLAATPAVAGVSPIVWASVPALAAAILAGVGMQGLAWAGKADVPWIGLCALVAVLLAGGSWLLHSGTGDAAVAAALLYAVSGAATACLLAVAGMGLRWHGFRWLVLAAVAGLDILFSAERIVDLIF